MCLDSVFRASAALMFKKQPKIFHLPKQTRFFNYCVENLK